jgi:hypothetical protein
MTAKRSAGTLVLLTLVSSWNCTTGQLAGESSAYAVVDALSAASGAAPEKFSGALASDVVTFAPRKSVDGKTVPVANVFEDPARVTMHLELKDPGSPGKPTAASPTNAITFARYRVTYLRADGRDVSGVDVPYGFDGGMTMTVAGGQETTGEFVLVRAQAKNEAPLRALALPRDSQGQIIGSPGGAIIISTIAKVVFYGADQAGRAVTAVAWITVTFADWGDPD